MKKRLEERLSGVKAKKFRFYKDFNMGYMMMPENYRGKWVIVYGEKRFGAYTDKQSSNIFRLIM